MMNGEATISLAANKTKMRTSMLSNSTTTTSGTSPSRTITGITTRATASTVVARTVTHKMTSRMMSVGATIRMAVTSGTSSRQAPRLMSRSTWVVGRAPARQTRPPQPRPPTTRTLA